MVWKCTGCYNQCVIIGSKIPFLECHENPNFINPDVSISEITDIDDLKCLVKEIVEE